MKSVRAQVLRIGFVGLAVTILGVTGCGGDVEPEPVLRPVRTLQVFSSGGERVRTFTGTARSGTESNLSFRLAGTLEQVPVDVGDSVQVGELIARIDPEDYRLQLREAEAGLAQAQAQAQNAQSSYGRVRDLYESDNASRADLDAALATFQSAEASVRAAQQRTQLARQQLSYTSLTAPAAGAVAAVNVEVNENVQPGQVIAMVTSGGNIEVAVAIPEVLISRIEAQMAVDVTFDALPDRVFGAMVSEVGVAAVGTATTYPVTVVLEDADADLRSGMAASVDFRFAAVGDRDLFLVPSVAVGEDREGTHVYVLEAGPDGTGTVRRRAVVVGDLTADGLQIREGLTDGEHVVTAGVSRIEDGLRVRLQSGG